MKKSTNFLLVVQGEGRGHMTQAIAMYKILTRNYYIVTCVLFGKSKQRELPQFVYDNIKCEIGTFESPNFVTDNKMKSVRMFSSIIKNIMRIGTFRRSIKYLKTQVKNHAPDVIVNFYDPLISLYHLFNRKEAMFISVAHQNIFLHPKYKYPKGQLFNRSGLRNYTILNSIHTDLRLALSFYPLDPIMNKKLVVVPPLLRSEVFEQKVNNGDYLLVYLVNRGYLEDICNWQKLHPEVKIHCFTDRKSDVEEEEYQPNLFLHKLNDRKFLKKMAGCAALVSTVGFESVAECMYLGKPALLVPIEGHFEQYCNARDAFRSGNVIYSERFELDKLMDYLKQPHRENEPYKEWVLSAENVILQQIESVYDIKNALTGSLV